MVAYNVGSGGNVNDFHSGEVFGEEGKVNDVPGQVEVASDEHGQVQLLRLQRDSYTSMPLDKSPHNIDQSQ